MDAVVVVLIHLWGCVVTTAAIVWMLVSEFK
jgi:hypothetical protein